MGLSLEEVADGYKSDSVWAYEAGVKMTGMNNRLFATVAAFQTDWEDIQQSVFLQSCASSFMGNAGEARVRGAEAELNGSLTPELSVRAAVGYIDAVITDNNDGRTAQAVGARVYNVPRLTASAGFYYARSFGDGREMFLSSDWSYVGDSVSANSSASTPQIRGAYMMGNARVGAWWGDNEVSLFVNNVTNELANYGDLAPVVSQGTLINGERFENARVVVSRPLQAGVQFKRNF